MNPSPEIPPTCAVAFKEWASVCAALGSGRQTLILRKGGIDEGPRGFQPEHSAFWLYPTHVHETEQGVKEASRLPEPAEDSIAIDILALVAWVGRVEDERVLDGLESYHVWTPETVAKRFHYRSPGLWVLVARMFHRHDPVSVPITPEHAGCKTWVPLDPPIATDGARPVLDEETFQARLRSIRKAVGE